VGPPAGQDVVGDEPTTPADRFLSPEIAADPSQRPGASVVSIKGTKVMELNESGAAEGATYQRPRPCRPLDMRLRPT